MALSTSQFSALRYLPALLPDALTIPTLGTSGTPTNLFSYGNLKATKRLVSLRSLQFPQSSTDVGTQTLLIATADRYSTGPVSLLSTLPMSSVRAEGVWNLPAASNLLQVQVQNPGADLSNFAANWSILVEEPAIAQKLKFPQSFTLTAAEQQLASKMGVTGGSPRGVLPRSFDWILENEFKNQVADRAVIGQYQATVYASGQPTLMGIDTAKGNEVLAIRSLYTSQGSGSDGLTLLVQVDDNDAFLTINAYGGGVALPMPCFILAEQQVAIYALSSSNASDVAMSMEVWHMRQTPEIMARMGEAVSSTLAEKIQAGIL